MSALRIEHVRTCECCSCDLRLLGETQFGLTVAHHLRGKNCVFCVLAKTAVITCRNYFLQCTFCMCRLQEKFWENILSQILHFVPINLWFCWWWCFLCRCRFECVANVLWHPSHRLLNFCSGISFTILWTIVFRPVGSVTLSFLKSFCPGSCWHENMLRTPVRQM